MTTAAPATGPTERWPDGDLVGFDLETTGPDPLVDVPVQYAFVALHGGETTTTAAAVVNPGRPIPSGATAVHGITDETAAGGVGLETAMEDIVTELLSASSRSVPLVGMNLAFDLTIVDATLRRSGGPGLVERGWRGPVIDLLVLDKNVDRYRKGRRRLGDLCDLYGVHDQLATHEAAGDAAAAVACVRTLASSNDLGDQSPEELHRLQVGWYREQQQGLSEYLERQGGRTIPEWQWEWPIWRRPAA